MMHGNCKFLNEDEVNYVIQNWDSKSTSSIADDLGCGVHIVKKVANENNLPAKTKARWTNEEIDSLVSLSSEFDKYELSDILNKSVTSVVSKAYSMKLNLKKSDSFWTDEQIIFLKEEWGMKSVKIIAKKVNKTMKSVRYKACKLNLGSMKENFNGSLFLSDVEELFNVSKTKIINTWHKNGLILKREKVSKRRLYYVEVDDLLVFLEENQNLWNSVHLEYETFGVEPLWLLEKRKKDYSEPMKEVRNWTSLEVKRAIDIFTDKKNYKDVAEALNRTEISVALVLKANGFYWRSERYWTDEELKVLRDNYETLSVLELSELLDRSVDAIYNKKCVLGYARKREKNK